MKERIARLLARVDRFQQRHRVLGLPIAVYKRFGEHGGSRLSATISYYAFFSLFPLLLVFVTILGLVLKNNPDLSQDLVDGALGQIPVIGSQLKTDSLPGQGWVLALGIVTALWAGLSAVTAVQHAVDTVADVPMHDRGNAMVRKGKAIAYLALLAVGISVSTYLSNLASVVGGGIVTGALGILATFAVNVLLLIALVTVLPAHRMPLRHDLPGVIFGAIGLLLLQQLGSFVVRRFISGASDTYGTFAIVIALLSWFFLVSRLLLLAAELNYVLARRLWPRRLVSADEPTDADRRATMLDVSRIQRDARLGAALSVDGRVATDDEPVRVADDQPATSR
jgi:membrane protein